MKRIVFQCFASMFAFFCIGFSNAAFAKSVTQHIHNDSDEKCYLAPGSLTMDEKGLYVTFNDTVCAVRNVSVDEHGVYVLRNELSDAGIIATCPVGHPNPPWNLVCAVCGRNLY